MTQEQEEAGKTARGSAKERIFNAAQELIYRQGINAVGVDAIASQAGATKMSLYRNFPSKDHLVAECLRHRASEFWAWWDDVVAPHAGKPRAQIRALFRAVEAGCGSQDSRGCALANAAVELTDDRHPGRSVVVEHKRELRERFLKLAREAGLRTPEVIADALTMLFEGANTARLVLGCGGPYRSVSKAADLLLDAAASGGGKD